MTTDAAIMLYRAEKEARRPREEARQRELRRIVNARIAAEAEAERGARHLGRPRKNPREVFVAHLKMPSATVTEKACRTCDDVKLVEEFSRRGVTTWHSQCKACRNAKRRKS